MPVTAHAAGAYRHATGTGQAAVGDDRHVNAPGGDGGQGVGQVELEGTAAHGGVVHVLGVQIQVVGQVHAAVADTAGSGEQAVHVLLGQAGVGQSLDDALPLNLQLALVRRVAGNVLVNAHDGRAMLKVNHKRKASKTQWVKTGPLCHSWGSGGSGDMYLGGTMTAIWLEINKSRRWTTSGTGQRKSPVQTAQSRIILGTLPDDFLNAAAPTRRSNRQPATFPPSY